MGVRELREIRQYCQLYEEFLGIISGRVSKKEGFQKRWNMLRCHKLEKRRIRGAHNYYKLMVGVLPGMDRLSDRFKTHLGPDSSLLEEKLEEGFPPFKYPTVSSDAKLSRIKDICAHYQLRLQAIKDALDIAIDDPSAEAHAIYAGQLLQGLIGRDDLTEMSEMFETFFPTRQEEIDTAWAYSMTTGEIQRESGFKQRYKQQ